MAVYSFRMTVLSRGKGRSATAAAAYRAGEKIYDERLDKVHDYSRRSGVYSTELVVPEETPAWLRERDKLWNAVEASEQRRDGRVAREITIALPRELNGIERQNLTRTFVEEQFVSRGMIADIAYHDFHTSNPHVHVLLTTRDVSGDGFGKKNRDWDKRALLTEYRRAWAEHTNRALEQAGHSARVDHRSLKEQGIDRVPQVHLGAQVREMEARGFRTQIGDEARARLAQNRHASRLELQREQIERELRRELRLAERTMSTQSFSRESVPAQMDTRSDQFQEKENVVENRVEVEASIERPSHSQAQPSVQSSTQPSLDEANQPSTIEPQVSAELMDAERVKREQAKAAKKARLLRLQQEALAKEQAKEKSRGFDLSL